MSERVYISTLQTDLHYKDRRSVRRWCHNNNVRILTDIGSNKQFVLKVEYENAKCRNYECHSAIQKPFKNFFDQNHNSSKIRNPEYLPRFENEKRMLSILQNIIPTL